MKTKILKAKLAAIDKITKKNYNILDASKESKQILELKELLSWAHINSAQWLGFFGHQMDAKGKAVYNKMMKRITKALK